MAVSAVGLMSAWAPASAETTKGFVVTSFIYATYDGGPADCPDGLNPGAREVYLDTLAPAERERLSRPENAKELFAALYLPGGYVRPGHHSHNSCDDPADFQAPVLKTVQGHVANGNPLSGAGADAPKTCAHETFASPTGEPGIDNQLWRVTGCIRAYRPGADIEKYIIGNLHSGEYTILLEVTGMDPSRKDGDVQVGFYSSTDQVSVDPAGNILPDSSLQVHANPHYHAVAHGRLVNGVVTTDPVDVHLKFDSQGYLNTEFFIRDARLRLELQPDGSAKGRLAGYYDLETFYDGMIRQGQENAAMNSGFACPAVYVALKKYADGFPDPKTGQCTAISTAFNIAAIPAFVIHQNEEPKKTADAGLSPQTAQGH